MPRQREFQLRINSDHLKNIDGLKLELKDATQIPVGMSQDEGLSHTKTRPVTLERQFSEAFGKT